MNEIIKQDSLYDFQAGLSSPIWVIFLAGVQRADEGSENKSVKKDGVRNPLRTARK